MNLMWSEWKRWIQARPMLYEPIRVYKTRQYERSYLALRDFYYTQAKRQSLVYDEPEVRERLLDKLGTRALDNKRFRDLHVYFVDDRPATYTKWQMHPALSRTRRLTISAAQFVLDGRPAERPVTSEYARYFNDGLLRHITQIHEEDPIDVLFCYATIGLMLPSTIHTIRKMGIATVSYWSDDHQSFLEHKRGTVGRLSLIDAFDLHWTTAKECALWYLVEGGLALYMPEGANPELCRVLHSVERDLSVSFLGRRYGIRGRFIEQLKNRGLEVACFGPGWNTGMIPWEEMSLIFNRSEINLGIGGIRHSGWLVHLKGRDFEVPMARGLCLTTYNPELAEFFDIGKEILCYKHVEECVELARYYLAHPAEAEQVREAAYQRARKEHTWEVRFRKLFSFLGAKA